MASDATSTTCNGNFRGLTPPPTINFTPIKSSPNFSVLGLIALQKAEEKRKLASRRVHLPAPSATIGEVGLGR